MAHTLSKFRVALADDEADSRHVLARLVSQLGYDVLYQAEDGEDLVTHGLEQEVDIVIVDLDMPNMDGLAAAEEVSKRGIPVILVTGHPDGNYVVVEQEPVVQVVAKPVQVPPLRSALKQAEASCR